MRQGTFLPESTFSADSLTVSVQPPCAIACINSCAHAGSHTIVWTHENTTHIDRKGQRCSCGYCMCLTQVRRPEFLARDTKNKTKIPARHNPPPHPPPPQQQQQQQKEKKEKDKKIFDYLTEINVFGKLSFVVTFWMLLFFTHFLPLF